MPLLAVEPIRRVQAIVFLNNLLDCGRGVFDCCVVALDFEEEGVFDGVGVVDEACGV